MKISNAARLIFWLAAIFAIGILVRAESGEKRTNTPNTKSAPLRIVDQNGRPAVNGVPSAAGTTVDVAVGHGGMCFCRTQSTSRWATRCGGPGPTAATVSPAVLLARPIRNFVPLTIRTAFREPSPTQASFTAYLYRGWHLFLSLHRALRYWHDRRGQCFGWLRTVRMVGRSGHAYAAGHVRLACISRLTETFTPWAVAPPTRQARLQLIRLNIDQAPTVGLRSCHLS